MKGFTKSNDRPDLTAFHYPVSYREGENKGNSVSIFEFKRPGRFDFTNSGSRDDPIAQIIRYARQMHEGNAKTPAGKDIQIADTTPFYGYVIASANGEIQKWLEQEKNMKHTPDGDGWYCYHDSLNLKIEYITWDKLLRDAQLRHRVFFEKLGL